MEKKPTRCTKEFRSYVENSKFFKNNQTYVGGTDSIGNFPGILATTITSFDTYYAYYPEWAKQVIKRINSVFHIDTSSALHFAAGLSVFMLVKFGNFQPANLIFSTRETGIADLCNNSNKPSPYM